MVTEIALQWIRKLVKMGVQSNFARGYGRTGHVRHRCIDLTKSLIYRISSHRIRCSSCIPAGKTVLKNWKLHSAAGCRRFDGAINGIGGCPMAGDELVGNMDSLIMIDYFKKKNVLPVLNESALEKSRLLANEIFLNH